MLLTHRFPSGERPAHWAAVFDSQPPGGAGSPASSRFHANVGVIKTAVDCHGVGRILVERDVDQAGYLCEGIRCRRGAFDPVLPAQEVPAAVVVLVHCCDEAVDVEHESELVGALALGHNDSIPTT